MGADEAGTALLLRKHRAAADRLVAGHGGRIVKTTGDGVLIDSPGRRRVRLRRRASGAAQSPGDMLGFVASAPFRISCAPFLI